MLNPSKKLYKWGPVSACPLFMYYAIEPSFFQMKKLFGTTYTESLIVFKEGKVTWFLDDKDLANRGKEFVEKNLKQDSGRSYFNLCKKTTKKFTGLFEKLSSLDFKTVSDKELIGAFKEFSSAYFSWFAATIPIELISSFIEPLLGSNLRRYFPKDEDKEYQKAFATLTAPVYLTFYRREQEDLLKIITLPEQKQKETLKRHQEEYYWIYNSYAEGRVLPITFFQKELEKYSQLDYSQLLNEIREYTQNIEAEKQRIILGKNLSEADVELARLVERISALVDERKETNFRAEHYLELFVRELARRSESNAADLKFLFPKELASSLTQIDSNAIKDRKKCLVFTCSEHGMEISSGQKALQIANQFFEVKEFNESMIHGQVASVGDNYYFRGTARVVHSISEIGKIQEGDVLVAPMTSPDYVIGMKKAGAIITDVGGMLSHAAIVSRELKKPCIVGTQFATEVIKNGDVVELHCGKGTVRIIKHAQ